MRVHIKYNCKLTGDKEMIKKRAPNRPKPKSKPKKKTSKSAEHEKYARKK